MKTPDPIGYVSSTGLKRLIIGTPAGVAVPISFKTQQDTTYRIPIHVEMMEMPSRWGDTPRAWARGPGPLILILIATWGILGLVVLSMASQ